MLLAGANDQLTARCRPGRPAGRRSTPTSWPPHTPSSKRVPPVSLSPHSRPGDGFRSCRPRCPTEDGAALNGLIRAQNNHLRGSLLELAAINELRIMHPDLYVLFFEILAPRLRLPRCELAGHSLPPRGGVVPVVGLFVGRSASSDGSPRPDVPVRLTLPLSCRHRAWVAQPRSGGGLSTRGACWMAFGVS